MAVVVFDSSVLIAYLSRADAHHASATEIVRSSLDVGNERCVSAATLSEILIGPLRAGRPEVVQDLVAKLSIEVQPIDGGLAWRGAAVRAATGLSLPDAYVVATALLARQRTAHVRVESFDRRLTRAYAEAAQES